MMQFARVTSVAVAIVCVACGRSDEQVTANLKSTLAAAKVDTSSLTIETKGPLITLSGTVASQSDREEITRIVRQSSGGKDVLDKMQVRTVAAAPSAPTGVHVTTAPSATATTAVETAGSSHEADHPVADAAKATGSAVSTAAKVGGDAVVDASKVTADATVDAAKVTGTAAAKGASATASGAKKLGVGIAHAVTPGEKSENSDKK